MRSEFLSGRVFASLEEAQAELDAWVEVYNTERPHQGVGMVPPQVRFALASSEALEPVFPQEGSAEYFLEPQGQVRRVLRKVNDHGRISLLGFEYHVGRYLLGETVEVELQDGGF